jgi:DNA-binding transcriptional LysR family regulator
MREVLPVLLRGAGRTLGELETTVDEVRSDAGQLTGRVRLGAWQSMEVRLPDLLAAFRHAYPAVDVAVNEIVSDAMLEAVRVGTLEAAMVVQREHVPITGLASRPFITEPYALAVAGTHALAQRRAVRLDELAEEPFVLHRPGSAVRDQILRACGEAGFRPRIALETGEMSAARAFVAAGLGITILPRSSLAAGARRCGSCCCGRLFAGPPSWSGPRRARGRRLHDASSSSRVTMVTCCGDARPIRGRRGAP